MLCLCTTEFMKEVLFEEQTMLGFHKHHLVPLHKALTCGLGLDDLSLAWPTLVQLVVSFNSGSQWILQRVLFFVLS